MAGELDDPVVVDFPLRGEGWMAVTTPAHRVPSHGTDLLGQRYAYDLLKVDGRRGVHFHPASTLRGELLGGRTRECYAWGAPIHAPFDAEVVAASDEMPEREWIHPAREIARAVKNAVTFSPEKIPQILGNHVVLRALAGAARRAGGDTWPGDVFAGFAHLVPGSVAVAAGQQVASGDILGRVGHTGNSTAPHLHFQLMDSADLMTAKAIPCAFRTYEVQADGAWVPVADGIPGRRDRIRWTDT
ncbi:M23 family metallopeptidase [Agromyces sp. ZXT2-6]|uniref:M23 family metallopeptidase n=1 Tax=Agromyces sp. ZXT2-6 TaxID=3461153 RepID=UPI004054EED3